RATPQPVTGLRNCRPPTAWSLPTVAFRRRWKNWLRPSAFRRKDRQAAVLVQSIHQRRRNDIKGTSEMKILRLTAAAALLLVFQASAFAETTLRIGLAEDPDILDPTMARTYVGRIVFSAFCDKLFDIDEKLNIVPQLALSHETSADGKEVTIKL